MRGGLMSATVALSPDALPCHTQGSLGRNTPDKAPAVNRLWTQVPPPSELQGMPWTCQPRTNLVRWDDGDHNHGEHSYGTLRTDLVSRR